MVKILIIGHTNLMGGVETFIYNSIIHSSPDKVQFDLLIHGYNSCVFQKEILDFYQNRNCLYFFPKIKKNPIKTIIKLLQFYYQHRNEYKYIHLQTGSPTEIVYCVPFYLLSKSKLIIHSHNGGNSKSKLVNKLMQPLLNAVAYKKLACSDVAGKFLFGNRAKGIQVINNGIDTEKFSFSIINRHKMRQQFNIKEEIIIGHVGRFSKQKNHSFLLDIFAEFQKTTDAKLLLIGTGELESEIKRKANELGINEKIIYAGLCNDVERYYSAMDVFVMPSLYEGLPIVGVEAQCNGLGCVFADTISNQIILTNNSTTMSLDAHVSQWVSEIKKHIVPIEKRIEGKNIVESSGFSIAGVAQTLEDIYLN